MPVDVDAAVISNTPLSSEYNVIALDAPDVAGAVAPGQFLMLRTTTRLDPLLRRPYSVFEILRDDHGVPRGVSVLNKRTGVGSTLLYQVAPGDRVGCLGPLGRPFTPVDPPAEAWMVAGGVGLAPFATLAETLRARGTPMSLFYGGRRASDLFYLDLFESLGARLVLATEDGSRGAHGRITAPLDRALSAAPADRPVTVFACGPERMLEAVAALARRHSRPSQLSMERVMGCGMGGCYSCVVRVRTDGKPHFVRSCLAGPVFNGDEIVWD